MKKVLAVFAIIALLISCSSKKEMTITVQNPSNFDRVTQMVEIPLDSIMKRVVLKDTLAYIVKNERGEIITSQLTYDKKIIFQSGLRANSSAKFTITTGIARKYKSLTYGRFIPERYDDFGWENDKVAFRIYGPALVKIDGPSNGLDIWYKRTGKFIINKWVKNDIAGIASYHKDHGEGLDGFDVGRSLGAGAMAPYSHGKLYLNQNYVNQSVFENGPLRTTFKLTYPDIDVDGKIYREARTISLDAGSQLSKIKQEYHGATSPITVAAGFSIHCPKNTYMIDKDKYYVAYTETMPDTIGDAYLGLVFPSRIDTIVNNSYKANDHHKAFTTYKHVLALMKYDTPITYYAGYGWSKFGFATRSSFENYLDCFSKSLRQPFIIKY